MSKNLVHKWLKVDQSFYPHSVISVFYFIARLCKQNSSKLGEMVDSKSCKQSAVDKLGWSLPKKLGPLNYYICSFCIDDFET